MIRSLKRPYRHVLLVVWAVILCTLLFTGLRRTNTDVSTSRLTNWVKQNKKTPSGETDLEAELHKEALAAGFTEEEWAHPRLHQRPLPTHASSAKFPNVPIVVHLPADDGSHISKEEIEQNIVSIWDLGDSRFYRTECDGQDKLPRRYEVLKELADNHQSSHVKYFFALDLYEVKKLLPRLMGTLVQVVKLLGPEKCAVSVVEGRSKDGTYAILLALKEKMETIGVRFYLQQSDINPRAEGVDRIGALSALRNMAIEPLIKESKNATGISTYDHDTILMFLNDIAVCCEDVYELLFQHYYQKAHQTCAMDWINGGNLFYDSWVSRSMSGDIFFEVPQDASWSYHNNMFWDHPESKDKYNRNQPFQVYSCWGGMITVSSGPFIDEKIKIRNSTKGECYAGEPTNLAKDLWKLGMGKILNVPTVNVGYNSQEGVRIKNRKGWVHTHVDTGKTEAEWKAAGKGTELVIWKTKPPGQVKCMPAWGINYWTDP